jgi:beta-glucosidase/6-phospho-beta-glucosidase/beta-galactosidase
MAFPKDVLFGTANADHQVEAHDPDTGFGLFFVDLDRDPGLRRVATPDVRAIRR